MIALPPTVLASTFLFSARLLCFKIEAHVYTLFYPGKYFWRWLVVCLRNVDYCVIMGQLARAVCVRERGRQETASRRV